MAQTEHRTGRLYSPPKKLPIAIYRWLVVWDIFYVCFHNIYEESSQLTHIFQRGLNHQPDGHLA
jgi:hypothetical protein